MKASIRLGAAALVTAFGLAVGAPASAQQAQPSAADVQLGVQFSERMLAVMDLNALMAKQMSESIAGRDGDIFKVEPKWRDFFLEAMGDEFKADHAAIVTVLGRAFARTFTADELKVGVVMFSDPAMAVVMKALQAGQPAPTDIKPGPATIQALNTPAGRSLITKMTNLSATLDGAKNDLSRVLLPGFFQRFGEKAVALERQRRQAEGLPALGG